MCHQDRHIGVVDDALRVAAKQHFGFMAVTIMALTFFYGLLIVLLTHFLAERMRASLELHPLQLREGPLALTVSIGVAGFDPGEGQDGSELYRAADRAMYRAKSDGRNRVRVDGA